MSSLAERAAPCPFITQPRAVLYPAMDLKIDRLCNVILHASSFNGLSITNICAGDVLLIGSTAGKYSVTMFFTLSHLFGS